MRKEPEATVRLKPLLIGGLIVILAGAFLVWWQGAALCAGLCGPGAAEVPARAVVPSTAEAEPGAGAPDGAMAQVLTGVVRRWTEVAGAEPAWPSDFSVPQSCEAVDADLEALCAAIDSRPGVGQRAGEGGFCGVLREAAEVLAARPPQPSAELRSYATMLANVFHLSRTLGRKRVELLRDVLNGEQETQELAAMTLYRWSLSRERCSEQQSEVSLSSMYEYSAFLLQSMGGQAYLRRRGPLTESLATFYSILVLDQALAANVNPHGIDPRPELLRCRGLLLSQPLVFRDRYIAVLDDIAARWEARSSQ